jgi:hypothetical protein
VRNPIGRLAASAALIAIVAAAHADPEHSGPPDGTAASEHRSDCRPSYPPAAAAAKA